jgi:hypothetical protein
VSQFIHHYNAKINELGQSMMTFPWHDSKAYGQWLGQTYYFVRENTRLLSLCSANLDLSLEALHCRFAEHTKEELGHSELLLRDLKGLKLGIHDYPECPETSAFYQIQYYWINQKSPLAFFGYILLLEGLAAKWGIEIFKKTKSHHGPSATTFLNVHAHEDIGHEQSALLEVAKFDTSTLAMVKGNFDQSCHFYNMILLRCKSATQSVESTAKAA